MASSAHDLFPLTANLGLMAQLRPSSGGSSPSHGSSAHCWVAMQTRSALPDRSNRVGGSSAEPRVTLRLLFGVCGTLRPCKDMVSTGVNSCQLSDTSRLGSPSWVSPASPAGRIAECDP